MVMRNIILLSLYLMEGKKYGKKWEKRQEDGVMQDQTQREDTESSSMRRWEKNTTANPMEGKLGKNMRQRKLRGPVCIMR